MMIDNCNFTNAVENIPVCLLSAGLFIQAYQLTHRDGDRLLFFGTDTQRRTRCTSVMGIKKRGRFSSIYVDKKIAVALSLDADKNEGDIPLLRTEKRAFLLCVVKKEGFFPLCGQKTRAILIKEGHCRGLFWMKAKKEG